MGHAIVIFASSVGEGISPAWDFVGQSGMQSGGTHPACPFYFDSWGQKCSSHAKTAWQPAQTPCATSEKLFRWGERQQHRWSRLRHLPFLDFPLHSPHFHGLFFWCSHGACCLPATCRCGVLGCRDHSSTSRTSAGIKHWRRFLSRGVDLPLKSLYTRSSKPWFAPKGKSSSLIFSFLYSHYGNIPFAYEVFLQLRHLNLG